MARYERSIYTDPDPKESRMSSEEKEERRRADERSLAPYERKAAEMEKRGKSRGGGGGGGGMNPIDLERVPGKRPLKMEGWRFSQSPQLPNGPMGLLKKAKPVEKWSDVFNQQHSVL
jgi:hypothetical protein